MMTIEEPHKPDLESRFLPPENWKSHFFTNPDTERKIRYASILVENPVATVVILPGLSEYCEKHIETARFFMAQNYNVYIIDWAYQGCSKRMKNHPHRRHSDGYKHDISDLHYLISHEIQGKEPLYFVAHSMGGHIALRYLYHYQNKVTAAALSAPMFGILKLRHKQTFLRFLLLVVKKQGRAYIPLGKDWQEKSRSSDGSDIFSSDPIRDKVHNAWCKINPALQVGNPTIRWVYESLKSIYEIKKTARRHPMKTPVLMAYGTEEKIVDNKSIQNMAKRVKNSELLELEGSKHEILMETDNVRDMFLKKALELFNR